MTIEEKISKYSKDEIKITVTPARPSEKTNEIYEIIIDCKKWFCERPKYHFSPLDRSLWWPAFFTEGQRLFGIGEKMTVFDKEGLWWAREELSSRRLIAYYLKHPLEYTRVMSKHFVDVLEIIEILKEVHKTLDNEKEFKNNLKRLAKAYNLFYKYPHSIFWIFDELIYQFKQFLLSFLNKRDTNIYLTKFLSAEITKEVIEKGYGRKLIIERPWSRGVLYACGTPPIVFYRKPKFFHEYPDDMEIIEKLKKLPSDRVKQFFAFRWIVPIAVQVNEEAQYVEAQMLSSHTCHLLKKIARKTNKSLDDLEQMSYQKILRLL